MPNLAPNPSFETDLAEWQHASGTAPTLARVSGGWHGSMQVTNAAVAQNVTVRTPNASGSTIVPVTPGDTVSIGGYGLWVTGTPKAIRCDLRWMINATTESGTQPTNGSSVTMNTSTWVQSKLEGATAPGDAVGARIRCVVVSAAASDVFKVDGFQIEKAATLPAFDTGSNAPTNFTVTPVSSSQLDLDWDPVSGATGYDIEEDGVLIATNVVASNYSRTGLAPSTTNDYRVRAVF
jgi:hypothetical protein